MKKLSFCLLATALLFSSMPAQAAKEIYTLDRNHSYVLWHINHFGFSNPSGKWYANGTLSIDKDKPQNNQANITINVANFDTGNPELDKHLSGALFFDVVKFPQATFVSDTFTKTGLNSFNLHGTLTLHGVAKPITLFVKTNKIGVNPITNKPTVGYTAKTQIKRSDFGITELLPDLSNDVPIEIEIEASKAP